MQQNGEKWRRRREGRNGGELRVHTAMKCVSRVFVLRLSYTYTHFVFFSQLSLLFGIAVVVGWLS